MLLHCEVNRADMDKIRERMLLMLLLLLVSQGFAKRKEHRVNRFQEEEGVMKWRSGSEPYAADFLDSFSWERNDDRPPKHQQSTKYTVKTKVSLTESDLEEPDDPQPEQIHNSKEQYSEYKPSKFREYETNSFHPLPDSTTKSNSRTTHKPVPVITRLPVLQLSKDFLSYSPPKSVEYNTSHSSIKLPSISPFTSHLPKTEYQISIVHAPHAQSQAYAKTNLPTLISYQATPKSPIIKQTSIGTTTTATTKTTTKATTTTTTKATTRTTAKRKTKKILQSELYDMDLQPLAAPKGDFGARIASKKSAP